MKKVFLLLATLLMVALSISLVACTKTTESNKTTTKEQTTESSKSTEKDTTVEDTTLSYTINVYDIDGEKLDSKTLTTKDYPTVLDALEVEFCLFSEQSQYGTNIISLSGSVIDPNWYMAIYENGAYASTGVDGLVIDEGDVFDFKMECWNTKESGYGAFDSYDVLVDKAIYHYAKTYMVDMIKKDTTFKGSNYWTYMAINMMATNGYDTDVFHGLDSTEEFFSTLTDADFSSFSQADWGKYYYTARALDKNLDEFITAYTEHVNSGLPEGFSEYGEYSIPFEVAPAKALNLTSDNLSAIIATEYKASTEWGIDGLGWEVAALQLWDKYEKSALSDFPLTDQGNATSDALILMVYAAFGESPRTETEDLIKTLFDTYYDQDLQLVKYAPTDTDVNVSTNQIYAYLMAYKVSRDLNKAVNLFA